MATAAHAKLRLINGENNQELALIKQNGCFKVGEDVVIGDLYKDHTSNVTILYITNKLPLETIEHALETSTNGGVHK